MNTIRTSFSILFAALLMVCSSALAVADDMQTDTAQVVAITVNVNSASAAELAEKLDGVGAARAELIVKYREEKGPFTSVEQLLEIKGIGTATLEKNRDRIQL
ncbi:ComEA family DNA-binding protein [Microbulbifer marinus]|uniref:Competence protein ComEA n=1 Tax=Microbulbifer marinus TaxID=658218 RepID=A0A1H3WIY7_9GAMM|nr:helix-hairpin-helix domain-containing protein [Microbulbifer marinus]SDZ86282.1 competence protein ComEA [Microbulbifer marinus]